jgi:superfamily II DNA/RNA helicase
MRVPGVLGGSAMAGGHMSVAARVEMPGLFSSAANQTSPAIAQALEAIDDLSIDSKLEAFSQLLGHLRDTKGPSRRICVLTDYLATLFYLTADIEGRGMKCMLLHGGMSFDERKRTLSSLATVEAILVATRAAIFDHFSLADVTDVVLYDIPANKIVLEQLLRRFDRFGRKAQLTVHVLVPNNISDGLIFESLRVLRNITGPEQKPLANEQHHLGVTSELGCQD